MTSFDCFVCSIHVEVLVPIVLLLEVRWFIVMNGNVLFTNGNYFYYYWYYNVSVVHEDDG